MIKFIHNHKQFITVIFLIVAACFMITGVGIDILHGGANSNKHLIQVNGQPLSGQDLERSERGVESRYRQMLGENFAKFAASLNLNIRQQAIDSLVDRTVLDQEAAKQGFAASDDAVRNYILTNIFKGEGGASSFSPANYRNLLQSLGMSAPQFENEIKGEIARTTLINTLRDAAIVTNKDAEELFKRDKTKYTFTAATVSANPSLITTASDEELKKYYESHATDYETPAQVAYSYLVFTPNDFEKDVQITPQDVEFFYSENAAKYVTPEQTHARGIRLLYPKESDPKKMANVRERATKAREEALSGIKFEDLVAKYSDDLPTKILGGDLGWIKKGDKPEKIEAALATTTVGSISELIETDYGFEIIKVEEKKPAAPRSLDEVRSEIERELRSREAPAYAANRARELLLQAQKSSQNLSDILPAGLSLKNSGGLLAQDKDPEPNLHGLTQSVFGLPASSRTAPNLIELGEVTALVQVKEFKEPATPPFEEVKARVVQTVKDLEARKVAEANANALLKAAQSAPDRFSAEAQARSAKLVGPVEISRSEPSADKFPSMTSQMRSSIFKAKAPKQVVDKVFSAENDFTVIKIEEIKVPSSNDPKNSAEIAQSREQVAQQVANNMISSTLETFKSRAQIEIDPALMSAQQ